MAMALPVIMGGIGAASGGSALAAGATGAAKAAAIASLLGGGATAAGGLTKNRGLGYAGAGLMGAGGLPALLSKAAPAAAQAAQGASGAAGATNPILSAALPQGATPGFSTMPGLGAAFSGGPAAPAAALQTATGGAAAPSMFRQVMQKMAPKITPMSAGLVAADVAGRPKPMPGAFKPIGSQYRQKYGDPMGLYAQLYPWLQQKYGVR